MIAPAHVWFARRRASVPRRRALVGALPKRNVTYVICTNPRSGSWLLSDGLTATGIAGTPREWFNPSEVRRQKALWRLKYDTDLTDADYLRLATRLSTTSNGVSGVKVHGWQVLELPRLLGMPEEIGEEEGAVFSRLFPDAHFIWLRRRDRVRQAISLWRALATGAWWSIPGAPPQARKPEPSFNAEAIADMEAVLAAGDARWERFFCAATQAPLDFEYEDLAADPPAVIADVLRWLGLPRPAALASPRLARQADSLSDNFISQYQASGCSCAAGRGSQEQAEARLLARVRRRPAIPVIWLRWVAGARMRGMTPDEIAGVLEANGFDRTSALAEASRTDVTPYVEAGATLRRRLAQWEAAADAQRRMAALDHRSRAPERHVSISNVDFVRGFYSANRPLVLGGLARDWQATTTWTPERLRALAADVPLGGHTTLGDVLQVVTSGADRLATLSAAHAPLCHPQAAELLHDLSPLPDFLTPSLDSSNAFLWLGAAGVRTPRHLARCNRLLVQIAGRRRFWLFPPLLGTATPTGGPSVGALTALLSPGDALFVPVGWWRAATAVDAALTVVLSNFVEANSFVWE